MAKINLVIKNINALFANINLHRLIRNMEDNANIHLALFAARVHFFITTTMIIQTIAVRIRNAIIHSFKSNQLLSCHRPCQRFWGKLISNE